MLGYKSLKSPPCTQNKDHKRLLREADQHTLSKFEFKGGVLTMVLKPGRQLQKLDHLPDLSNDLRSDLLEAAGLDI